MENKNFIKIEGDYIVGFTYVIKGKLKEHGCVWSPKKKLWSITKETNLDEVSKAINEYNEGGKCDKCEGKCKPGYHICYNCLQQLLNLKIRME